MTREEAIAKIREAMPTLWKEVKDAIQILIPELSESEDERIRKEMIAYFQDIKEVATKSENIDKWIAYLEKQKAKERLDRMAPIYNDKESFESALEKAWKYYNESASRKVDSFEDDYIECVFSKGFREGFLYREKQKEQEHNEGDFTIYHPLKNGKGKYECIPYSFYGSLTSFSEDKDLIDFLRTCFYTEEECNEWIEQQKEQKPMESALTDFELKLYTVISAFVCEYERDKEANLIKFVKEYSSVLLESAKEQKFTEKQDYSDLTDLERAIHRGFLVVGVENVPVTIIKETAQDCLAWMKPAEWSEEEIRTILDDFAECKDTYTSCINRLKSLRPHQYCENCKLKRSVENWKPSEEQMYILSWVANILLNHDGIVEKEVAKKLQSLYNDLQKLL